MATPKGPSPKAGPFKTDEERRRRTTQTRARQQSGTDVQKYFTPQANRQRVKRIQSREGRKAITALVAAGGGKTSGSSRSKFESWFGAPWSGANSGTVVGSSQASLNKVRDNLVHELKSEYTERAAIEQEYAQQVTGEPVNPNEVLNQDFVYDPKSDDPNERVRVAPAVDEQFLGGHVGQVMEKVQRPMAALAGGLRNAKAEEDPNASTWDQFIGSFGSFWEGAGKGIRGEEHHGMGDVYELVKNTSDNQLAKGLRNLEERAPWAEQTVALGAGALDLAMDPTNYIGLKGVAMAGKKVANAQTMRSMVDDIAEKITVQYDDDVVQHLTKGPGGISPAPSQPALKTHVVREIENMIEAGELDITGGGSRNRYRMLSPKLTAETAGAMGGQAIQQAMTQTLRDSVQRVLTGLQKGGRRVDGNDLADMAHLHPDFEQFVDQVGDNLVRDGRVPRNYTYDDIADNLVNADHKRLRDIELDVINKGYADGIAKVTNNITAEFANSYYHAPAIRVGKKAIPIKGVGRAYATMGNKVAGSAARNFNYNAAFPGSLSVDASRARAYMVPEMEAWEKTLRQKAKGFSPEEVRSMQHAVDQNKPGLTPEQQSAMDWHKKENDEWYEAEMDIGVRGRQRRTDLSDPIKPTTVKLDNYTYVYNRGGSLRERTEFKRDRKTEINNPKVPGAGRYNTAGSKAKNLKPHENMFEAMRQRRIKHNRDMTRALFRADMVDKYGIFSKMDSKGRHFSAESRNLEIVNFEKLPERLRLIAEKEGGDYFLPRQMAEMLDQFDEITQWNGAAQGQAARFFTKVMSAWKTIQTLPWPGFHNKNAIGDFFMGFLDHINPDAYIRVASMFTKAAMGKNAVFKFAGGLTYSLSDMWKRYQMEANSGFAHAELGGITPGSAAKYNIPKRVYQATYTTMKNISGIREDLGRFTHYVEAFRQEAKELYARGEKDISKLDAKAGSAAHWRVNNYRFDYNALSLWEKKVKTLAFPFYTFIRKAAPTLVQAIYQDPRWINQWTRYMYQNSQGEDENGGAFDQFRIPEDIRMMGYAMLDSSDSAEPWYVSNDILPTGALNSVRTNNSHEFFNSILSQMMAPGQFAVQQGTGRDIFQDKPLEDQSFLGGIKGMLPGVREWNQFKDPNATWQERLISHRYAGGLPIRELSENQQQFATQQWNDRLIDEPLQDFNYSQTLYHISETALDNGQRVYQVKDNQQLGDDGLPGRIVQRFYTAREAIAFAKNLIPSGYREVETIPEFDNQGNIIQRPVGR